MRTVSCLGWLCVCLLAVGAGAQDITVGKPLLADDFERFTGGAPDLGRLSLGDYAWGKRVPIKDGVPEADAVQGAAAALIVGYDSGAAPYDTGVFVAAFQAADAVISLQVGPSHQDDRCHDAIVSYRALTTAAAAGGYQPGAYHVEVVKDWSGSRDVVLRYGGDELATGDVAVERLRGDSQQVTVAFAGDRHMVWVAGRKVIDHWETEAGRRGAGYLGFGAYYSIGSFDDFRADVPALGEGSLAVFC